MPTRNELSPRLRRLRMVAVYNKVAFLARGVFVSQCVPLLNSDPSLSVPFVLLATPDIVNSSPQSIYRSASSRDLSHSKASSCNRPFHSPPPDDHDPGVVLQSHNE